MLSIGVLIDALHRSAGHYFVEGVGYATIEAILRVASRRRCSSRSFSSRSSTRPRSASDRAPRGGIFSPSLFMGATAGRERRRGGVSACAAGGRRRPDRRDHRYGGGRRRRDRRRDDRGDEDLRDDARLRAGDAEHHRGRAGDRREAPQPRRASTPPSSPIAVTTSPERLHANMFMVRHANQVMERDVIARADGHRLRRFPARPPARGENEARGGNQRRPDRRLPAREHGVARWRRERIHGRQTRRRGPPKASFSPATRTLCSTS